MGRSRRQWGWHQLDRRWAERLVAESGVGRGDIVLDIGAGIGAITRHLVDTGAVVIAVERHPQRRAVLRARFGDRVTVIAADAADLRLPRQPFHVVANPPFAVTSALLRRLLQPGTNLLTAALVLDERAVMRWAGPNAPAANRWRRDFHLTASARLPRDAFHPPPDVACRVLTVRRR